MIKICYCIQFFKVFFSYVKCPSQEVHAMRWTIKCCQPKKKNLFRKNPTVFSFDHILERGLISEISALTKKNERIFYRMLIQLKLCFFLIFLLNELKRIQLSVLHKWRNSLLAEKFFYSIFNLWSENIRDHSVFELKPLVMPCKC